MGGWIKLHRCIKDKAIFDNEKLLKVFVWCLLKATHTEHEQLVGRKKVLLNPGQFITGRNKAGAELNMSPSTAWEYLKILEENKSISIKSNNKFSIVSIENWGLYQSDEEKSDNKSDSKLDNKSTTNQQQIDTNKNVKNDKNVKEDIYILSDDEKQFLDILNQIENYPLDREKDLEMYKTLGERYPALNLLEAIEQWKMYKLDQPLKAKSNPRSQINTSFKKYVEWGKCLKNNKTASKSTQSNFKRTRFHTEKNRTDNYTNDELEDIFQRKRREAKERQERGG